MIEVISALLDADEELFKRARLAVAYQQADALRDGGINTLVDALMNGWVPDIANATSYGIAEYLADDVADEMEGGVDERHALSFVIQSYLEETV